MCSCSALVYKSNLEALLSLHWLCSDPRMTGILIWEVIQVHKVSGIYIGPRCFQKLDWVLYIIQMIMITPLITTWKNCHVCILMWLSVWTNLRFSITNISTSGSPISIQAMLLWNEWCHFHAGDTSLTSLCFALLFIPLLLLVINESLENKENCLKNTDLLFLSLGNLSFFLFLYHTFI